MAGGAYLSWKATTKSPGGLLQFDAVTSESLVFGSTVTEFPVEEGANVADHVRENLDHVSLDVFVTNHPIDGKNRVNPDLPDRGSVESVLLDIPVFKRPINSLSSAISAGLGALSRLIFGDKDPDRATLLTFSQKFSATGETYEVLRQLVGEKRIVEVVTRDWYCDSMIVENVTKPRARADGSGARFTIELKQIRIVETLQTFAPVPAEPRGKGIAKAGAVGANPASDPTKKKSILKGLVGSVF